MPCIAVIHLRGRGRPNDGDWEANDVVQVFDARKRGSVIEAFINNVWMTDLGRYGSREFLALYVPDGNLKDARAREGRGLTNVSWESHFTARERDKILDRTVTIPFQERPSIGKALLRERT